MPFAEKANVTPRRLSLFYSNRKRIIRQLMPNQRAKAWGGCRCRWRLPQALPPPTSWTFAAGITASLIQLFDKCPDSGQLAIRMSVGGRVFPRTSGKLPEFG